MKTVQDRFTLSEDTTEDLFEDKTIADFNNEITTQDHESFIFPEDEDFLAFMDETACSSWEEAATEQMTRKWRGE